MIQFTKFISDKGPLTKRYYAEHNAEGEVCLARRDGGRFSSGIAETISIKRIEDLIEILNSVNDNPNQAIGLGISDHEKVNITTEKLRQQNNPSDTISRSKKFFRWPTGAGLMLIDHDIKPGYEQYWIHPQLLIDQLAQLYKPFKDEKFIFRPSTSSFIYKGDELLSRRQYSYHIYFAIQSFKHADTFWNWLFEEAIVDGHGYAWVDAAGRIHERTFFDKAVFSPERIVYEAGCVCEYPLEQRLPPWKILEH